MEQKQHKKRIKPSDCEKVDIDCPPPTYVVKLPDGRFRAVNAEERFESESPAVDTAQEAADYLWKLDKDIGELLAGAKPATFGVEDQIKDALEKVSQKLDVNKRKTQIEQTPAPDVEEVKDTDYPEGAVTFVNGEAFVDGLQQTEEERAFAAQFFSAVDSETEQDLQEEQTEADKQDKDETELESM